MNACRIALLATSIAIAIYLTAPWKQRMQIVPQPNNQNSDILSAFRYQNDITDFPFSSEGPPRLYRAYLAVKSMSAPPKVARQNDKDNMWESIGPMNIGGRTLSIAINPKDTAELWMGSAGGGLWHSRTGGLGPSAWHYVPTGYPVLAVHAIAIHPTNPDVLYIGTGEIYNFGGSDGGLFERTLRGSWGIGILKSTDHGRTWNLVLDWTMAQHQGIFELIIDEQNPEIVYAASTHGIWKTENSGATWRQIFDRPMVTDLHLDQTSGRIVYAGVGGLNATEYGLFRSQDAGHTWHRITSPYDQKYQGRIMIGAYKRNPARIFVCFSDKFRTLGFMRTRDHFESTKFFAGMPNVCQDQGWYVKGLHYKDDDSSKMLIGGVEMYRDESGTGNQLVNLSLRGADIHPDIHDIISNPHDPQKIYVATDGGLYRSFNFGTDFIPCNGGYHTTQFYTASCDNNNRNRIIGGLQDNGTCLYNGSMNDWRRVSFGDGTYNAFHPDSSEVIYSLLQHGVLLKSLNTAKSWMYLTAGDNRAAFISPFVLNEKRPNHLYLGLTSLWHSHNGGYNWNEYNIPFNDAAIIAIASSPINENEIIISVINRNSSKAELLMSRNNGRAWVSIGATLPNRFLRKILWYGGDTITLAFGGYNAPHLFRSIDRGQNFAALGENLPDYPVHTIANDPRSPNIMYLGSDLGLFISLNYGKTFHSYNHPTFDVVQVYDLKHNEYENKLAVFTHGLGAFLVSYYKTPTQIDAASDDITLPTIVKRSQLKSWMQNFRVLSLYDINGNAHTKENISEANIVPGIYFALQKESRNKIFVESD